MGGWLENNFQILNSQNSKPHPPFFLFTMADKMYWVLIIHKSQITKFEATPPPPFFLFVSFGIVFNALLLTVRQKS